MRMLWAIHHLCEFQALIDHFLIRKWMVSDDSDLSDNNYSILTLRKQEMEHALTFS